MAENEVIEIIRDKIETCEFYFAEHDRYPEWCEYEFLEALGIAISTLKEIQQYREIGTVEECQEAREKQIPKKPVCKPKPYNESVGFNEEWFCPSCGAYIGYFYEGMDEPEQMEYCNECGQHIARDWSDENEDE